MAPYSSTLAWKIPWMEEPGGLQSMGVLQIRHDWATSLSCIGEGNGNPLQNSCLENPRDGGPWWAAAYGVAQSRTRLKWLSSNSILKHSQVLCLTYDTLAQYTHTHTHTHTHPKQHRVKKFSLHHICGQNLIIFNGQSFHFLLLNTKAILCLLEYKI